MMYMNDEYGWKPIDKWKLIPLHIKITSIQYGRQHSINKNKKSIKKIKEKRIKDLIVHGFSNKEIKTETKFSIKKITAIRDTLNIEETNE